MNRAVYGAHLLQAPRAHTDPQPCQPAAVPETEPNRVAKVFSQKRGDKEDPVTSHRLDRAGRGRHSGSAFVATHHHHGPKTRALERMTQWSTSCSKPYHLFIYMTIFALGTS